MHLGGTSIEGINIINSYLLFTPNLLIALPAELLFCVLEQDTLSAA